MPRAYSYSRFSSEKQKLGVSLQRQIGLAEAYALKHGLELDTHSYQDLGVSAFKGKNAVDGKLGTFLEAVRIGKIPRGSLLLIESLDRLSREDALKAFDLFRTIIVAGISIVTLSDGIVYSQETINANIGWLVNSIMVMSRANEESLTKSKRVKDAINRKVLKALNGEPEKLTSVCPGWIQWSKDEKKFELHPVNAPLVKRMFELWIAGHGAPAIARMFNREKIPTFMWKTEWQNGTINIIINNPATYGTLRRKDPNAPQVPNYYPAVIDEATFRNAKVATASRSWVKNAAGEVVSGGAGIKGKGVANLFSGFAHCGKCGRKLRTQSGASNSPDRPSYVYLVCLGRVTGSGCNAPRFPLEAIEYAVLENLLDRKGRHLLEHTKQKVDPTAALRVELDENKLRLSNLVRLAERAKSDEELDAYGERIKVLTKQIADSEKAIKKMEGVQPVTRGNFDDAAKLFKEIYHYGADGPKRNPFLSQVEMYDLRLKLQGGLKRLVTRLDVMPDQETVRCTLHNIARTELLTLDWKYEKPAIGSKAGDTRLRDFERAKKAAKGIVYTPAKLDWEANRYQQKKARAAKAERSA